MQLPTPTQISLRNLAGENVLLPADVLLVTSLFKCLQKDPEDERFLIVSEVLSYCERTGLLSEDKAQYHICDSNSNRLSASDFIEADSWSKPWHASLTLIRSKQWNTNPLQKKRLHETLLCDDCVKKVADETNAKMSGAGSSTDR